MRDISEEANAPAFFLKERKETDNVGDIYIRPSNVTQNQHPEYKDIKLQHEMIRQSLEVLMAPNSRFRFFQ